MATPPGNAALGQQRRITRYTAEPGLPQSPDMIREQCNGRFVPTAVVNLPGRTACLGEGTAAAEVLSGGPARVLADLRE
jgi:hypothetical protein